MGLHEHELFEHYESLWQDSIKQIKQGQLQIDHRILNKQIDARRGLTVVARLSSSCVEQIEAMVEKIKIIEPNQYFYPPADLHLTVLSLFTATENHQEELARLDSYKQAVENAVRKVQRFTVDTVGITAAPGAVMIQGFPRDQSLNALRNRLRSSLYGLNLAHSLDSRYFLKTAHTTFMRFTHPMQSATEFIAELEKYRTKVFGSTCIHELDLVFNDWYMSWEELKVIQSYHLDSK